ncbi:MAG: FtsX-like permease family protein [Candidatus Eremiobacteraeota bacterium]|nr:FtsX-like permease family protein [Candidatus Eremiobacteraeota bacterium]
MTTLKIVMRELFEKKNQLITSFLAILIGITVIVATRTMSHSSQVAVAEELDNLGANALIIPKSATVNDYYRSDFEEDVIPESYVDTITLSSIQGILNLSPKLTKPIALQGKTVNFTGVLPKNELKMPPSWKASANIFTEPAACGPKPPPLTKENQMRRKIIEALGADEVIVGSEAARLFGLQKDSAIEIKGRKFRVKEVYPETGTIDDTRIIASLHVVQNMFNTGKVINMIELVGCCSEIKKGMLDSLNKLLPDAKVVTITQLVKTQQKTNEMLDKFSMIFFIVIVLVGGIGIANYMFSNVHERRREIAIMIAVGSVPNRILHIFLLKALILGFTGGILGYAAGTIMALFLGPKITGVSVNPIGNLLLWAVSIAVVVSVLSSLIPASRAAHVDPVEIFQEV